MSGNNDSDWLGEVTVILSASIRPSPGRRRRAALQNGRGSLLLLIRACAGNNGGYPYFFVDDLNLSSFEVLKFMSGVNGKLFGLTAPSLSL